jgi:NSS family neurotransmitter:Na+ symporter
MKLKEKDNHEWDRPIEFVFSLISNSVGLGNVWRFPYLAAKNGGGLYIKFFFFDIL